MTRHADDDLEQAAWHRGDTEDREAIGQIGFSGGSVDTKPLERESDLLRVRHAKASNEGAPQVGLPTLMRGEVMPVGGYVTAFRPPGEHRRPIHLVAIEEVGDAASAHHIVGAAIKKDPVDLPGQSIDRPGMVVGVSEGAGSERSGKGELDIGADTEPLREPMGEPTADRRARDHHEFGGEGVIEGFA